MKKKVVWGRLQSLTEGVPSVPLSEDETVIGRKDVGGGNMNISSRHFKVIRSRAEGKEEEKEEKEEKEKGGKDKDKGGGEETKGKEASSTATKYTLVDTSTNGTYVNKERATKNVSTVIQDGYDVSMLDPVKCSDLAIKYIFTVLAEEEEEKQQHGPQDTYTFGEVLGTGHFAVVRKVCDHAGCYYAMKVIEKAKISSPAAGKEKEGAEGMEAAAAVSKRTKKIMDEAAILRKVSHPNIVTIKDVFETKRKVYIIMEL